MARTPSEFAELFVMQLDAKHDCYTFTVEPGNKFDRIVQTRTNGYDNDNGSVHAFVCKKSGAVYKPAGWSQPAKGIRYENVFAAAEASDAFGAYLYR